MDTGENTLSKEYYEALTKKPTQKDKAGKEAKFMGVKLIFALINAANGDVRKMLHDISKPNLIQRASSGLMVYENVLWMRMFEVRTNRRLPNGAKWFEYVPFWKPGMPKGKRLYVFRKNYKSLDGSANDISDAHPSSLLDNPHLWTYGTF